MKAEELVSAGRAGSAPRVSGSVSLDWGLRMCVSSMFSGEADAAGLVKGGAEEQDI